MYGIYWYTKKWAFFIEHEQWWINRHVLPCLYILFLEFIKMISFSSLLTWNYKWLLNVCKNQCQFLCPKVCTFVKWEVIQHKWYIYNDLDAYRNVFFLYEWNSLCHVWPFRFTDHRICIADQGLKCIFHFLSNIYVFNSSEKWGKEA